MRAVQHLLYAVLPACVLTQTFTSCDPLKKTCPPDPGLGEALHVTDFTKGASSAWSMTYGSVGYNADGALFTVAKAGNAPTMQTNFYIFFGSVSVLMRSAPGTGIVSAVVLESDDLDELDWEWLGGAPDHVQTNYFGKGNTTSYDRGTTVGVANAQGAVHNYTLEWTPHTTTWFIDGTPVRTLHRADALGGLNYPQTPMRVKLGIWAGGNSPNEGTVAWAGGRTNFAVAPFTMTVEKVFIRNANPAVSYTYLDNSGSSDSIHVARPKAARRNAASQDVLARQEEADAPQATAVTTAQATTLVTTTRPSTTVIKSTPTVVTSFSTTTVMTTTPANVALLASEPPPAPTPTTPRVTWVPDLLAECTAFPYVCEPPL